MYHIIILSEEYFSESQNNHMLLQGFLLTSYVQPLDNLISRNEDLADSLLFLKLKKRPFWGLKMPKPDEETEKLKKDLQQLAEKCREEQKKACDSNDLGSVLFN